jgi:hypothetical protein
MPATRGDKPVFSPQLYPSAGGIYPRRDRAGAVDRAEAEAAGAAGLHPEEGVVADYGPDEADAFENGLIASQLLRDVHTGYAEDARREIGGADSVPREKRAHRTHEFSLDCGEALGPDLVIRWTAPGEVDQAAVEGGEGVVALRAPPIDAEDQGCLQDATFPVGRNCGRKAASASMSSSKAAFARG